jgi:predicted metal-binding protein
MQQRFRYALVVQIIVPSLMIYSNESRELGRYLYELVATIEQEAVKMGYSHSIAFAGGSCKQLFCYNHPACQKIATGECRYPQIARTSMSGYGINVFEMIGNCGWEVNLNSDGVESETEAMSWIAGLVLVG